MKIGILTFHDGINHGAYLQAYALQNYLKDMGYKNEIINYKNIVFTLNEYKCFLLARTPVKIAKNIAKIIKFKKCHKNLALTRRIFTKQKLSKVYFDVVIIGSDSVWNYTNPLNIFDSVYFSDAISAKKIISYAASFGPDSCIDLYPKELPTLFKRFDCISVRDNNTKCFVKKLTNEDADLVLDPTFLYGFEKEIIEPKYENYILIYSLGLTPSQIENITNLAKKLNKQIISIGYENKWCDKNIISVSPFEWLGFFKKADFIVTSMYHGTLFSIKFNKPFCSIVTPYRTNKIKDFLERMGLSDRIILSDSTITDKIYSKRINFEKVNNQLQKEMQTSEDFLKRCLTDE